MPNDARTVPLRTGDDIIAPVSTIGQRQASEDAPQGEQKSSSNFGPCMGNFSIQYNFTAASIAVSVLGSDDYLGHAYSKSPAWAKTVTLPIVFVGAMIGMFGMGRLGDLMGRQKAMLVTLSFAIVGAIVPACAVGPPDAVYAVVVAGRLILGIGVGGIYPLSAVSSAEGQKDSAKRAYTVAWAFFWQSVGCIVPYLVGLILFSVIKPEPPQEWVPSFEFRFLFALGTIPACITLWCSWRKAQSGEEEFKPSESGESIFSQLARQETAVKLTLVGTAGSWFLWDIVYYGTAIFIPVILQDIFGEQTLFTSSWQSVIVSGMCIPGSIAAILLIKQIGCKKLNVIGFILLAVNFALMAILWEFVEPVVLFILFCVLNFLLGFGPNLGTYVLPAICFPSEIRSTCHGISATAGKVGAMAGAFMFSAIAPPAQKGEKACSECIVTVLWIQTGASLVGAYLSYQFLKNDWDYLNEDDKHATESFILGVDEAEKKSSMRISQSLSSQAA